MKKPIQRGSCLTGFLSLMILANVTIGFYFAGTLLGLYPGGTLPFWMILFSAVICLANVACAVGTWLWRRWGVFGYGALAVISYITNVVVTGNYWNFIGLAGSGVLVALVLPNWKQMR